MKKLTILFSALVLLMTLPAAGQTNDFYDDAPTVKLKGNTKIFVTGEIEKDVTVDITRLPKHSITVKETTLSDGAVGFTGAYRYDGYSLYDILDRVVLKKKNEAEFPPIIDLYVEITNDRGETALFSWGEIYYPVNRHRLMIATSVARIVPSKAKDLWPLPAGTKIVAGNDLVTSRNISNPVKITVKSLDSKYAINKGMSPMFSETMKICVNGKQRAILSELPEGMDSETYHTVFYGRGMGIHGTTPFTGAMLHELIKDYYRLSPEALQKGMVVIAGLDGYRAAFTLSEIANRNDQQELLIIDRDNYEGAGRFSLFPAGDFFSDRAIKAVMEIDLLLPKAGAPWAIVIHGGAGIITRARMTPEADAEYRRVMQVVIDSGAAVLSAGGSALDAVERAIRMMEDSPLFNAGKGAVFTHEGRNELDAAVMDGSTLAAGAVAGVIDIRNPITAARAVMEQSPHVMLTGRGASEFAADKGLEIVDPSYFREESRFRELQRAIESEKHGTVGCVALDMNGDLVAGTSTGGMTNKRYNRIGDVPIIGAGTYANNATCAVSATGHGEFFIRYTVAHDISALMEYKGLSLDEAASVVVHDKLVKAGGTGGIVSVDRKGNVSMPFNTEGMYRGYRTSGGKTGVFIFSDEPDKL
ncbi:MAG: isoaspartyl peptidase/L-asparaginase family protein [Bacteroidales bacterium]